MVMNGAPPSTAIVVPIALSTSTEGTGWSEIAPR